MWDEAFCRREKMPFCMQILSGDDACAPMGQEIVIPPNSIAEIGIIFHHFQCYIISSYAFKNLKINAENKKIPELSLLIM